MSGFEKTNRLAIIITSSEHEQILSIPSIENLTGVSQADEIYKHLLEWGLYEKISSLRCDTTNSNLGTFNGAAVILEHKLNRMILYVPCRHHIFEVVLHGDFDSKMAPSKSPDVPIFKRFQLLRSTIDQTKFKTVFQDKQLMKNLESDCLSIISFVEEILENPNLQPQDDYREFLSLTLVFLEKVDGKVVFSPLGAFHLSIHHDGCHMLFRYSSRIYLFADQFTSEKSERKKIRELCLFIIKIYVEASYIAPKTVKIPNHDLNFMKKLMQCKSIDRAISQAAVEKMPNHLWYLSP